MSTKTFNNKKVVITRPVERSQVMAEMIKEFDGIPIIVPTLELKLVESDELIYIANNINDFDWIVFTSPAGVESFFNTYKDETLSTKVAVIGVKTEQKLGEYGIKPNLIPDNFTAEGLLESFEQINIENNKIALPRTLSARKVLPEGLESLGATVLVAEAYTSSIPSNLDKILSLMDEILQDKIDIITFTSPLTVKNLLTIVKEENPEKFEDFVEKLRKNVTVASIGPITGKVLKQYSIPAIEAERYTVKDMIEKLLENID